MCIPHFVHRSSLNEHLNNKHWTIIYKHCGLIYIFLVTSAVEYILHGKRLVIKKNDYFSLYYQVVSFLYVFWIPDPYIENVFSNSIGFIFIFE
jgi:hypothetical protein